MTRFWSILAVCLLAGLCLWVWWQPPPAPENTLPSVDSPTFADPSASPSASPPQAETEPTTEANQPPSAERSFAADFLQTIPEGDLKRGLQSLPPELREATARKLRDLQIPTIDLINLRVDPQGHFFYVCEAPGSLSANAEMAGQVPRTAPGDAAIAVPVSSPPIRHSRPGASRVAFLDFNGHTVTGTSWNSNYGVTSFVCNPYDTDGNTSTFSDSEQAAILRIWARVAEDFAPFDVDVTTEAPSVFNANTARVLITNGRDANGQTNPEGNRAGGVAYLSVFGESYDPTASPAFVYTNNLGNEANVAEAASHEFGHNLGLIHDGTSTRTYYSGHGSGDTSWGPIMGTGYGQNVSQWSQGEYYDANNNRDDLAILAARLTYLTDDIADSPTGAQPLNFSDSTVTGTGIIERTNDADRFSFQTRGGRITLIASPFKSTSGTAGGNLDIKLELYNSNNIVVATADPAATTAATITSNVAKGTYTLRVLPTGTGNPQAYPPSGYTVYGSLGAYSITGTVPPSTDPVAPVITTDPLSQSVITGGNAIFSVTATGSAPLTYQWKKGTTLFNGQTARFLNLNGVQPSDAGSYTVTVTNPAGSTVSAAAQLTVVSAPIAPGITAQPASQAAVTGSTVTFTITTNGSAPINYQWRRNGVAIGNAIGANLTLPGVTLNEAGGYSVVVNNSVGTVTSAVAVLTVYSVPVFTLHPLNRAVVPGESAIFNIATSGLPTPILQWQSSSDSGLTWTNLADSTNVSGVTTGTLTLSALTTDSSGHRIRCVATNSVGSAFSDPANLTVAVQPPVTAIANSAYHTLYLKADGTVWATGDNTWGQFGNGSTTAHATPIQVADQATAIATGNFHSLVLKADGSLMTTGSNSFGALGDATTTDRLTFVQVATDVSAIAARSFSSAFIRQDGTLWAMGDNRSGQLGDGTLIQRNQPVLIASSVKAVALGNNHMLYLQSDGTLHAVGGNGSGQIGDGTTTTNRLTPFPLATQVTAIAAGYNSSFYLKSDDTLWAVGENRAGQYGNGSSTSSSLPVQVASNRHQVSVNFTHMLSFDATTGSLFGSGNNQFNQMTGDSPFARSTAEIFALDVATAEAGNMTSHWVMTDGSTWAVGKNISGQLGDASTTNTAVPVRIFSGVPTVGATPDGPEASDGSSSVFVRLTWPQLPGGMTYEIWRHTTNNSAAATRIAAGETTNFFNDHTAVSGTVYHYWVRAVGPGGAGPFSPSDTGYRVAQDTAPSFVLQPASGTVLAGNNTSLTVTTAGDPPPSLQWQVSTNAGATWGNVTNSGVYQGATNASLSLTNVPANYTGYRYRCIATNSVGAATSTSATLTVNAAPQAPIIITNPISIAVTENSSATFSVTATGTAPLSYQWRYNNTAIPSATDRTYTIPSAQYTNAGTYHVVVTNAVNSAVSTPATLIINSDEAFSPLRKTVSSIAQNYPVKINTSGAWTVSESLSWLRVSHSSGSGAVFVQVYVDEHTGSTPRAGSITINGIQHTVTQLPENTLDSWHWRNPYTQGPDFRRMVWNGQLFAAVGDRGAIQTSADGINWTVQTEGSGLSLWGLAWGADRFVATGGFGRIRTSPDGINWTDRYASGSPSLQAVSWGGNQFVAVGTAGKISTSPDGITWTARTSGTTNELRHITWVHEMFIATGANGTLLTSSDGITWSTQVSGMTSYILSATGNGTVLVATGASGQVSTSTDGVTWTKRTSGTTSFLYGVIWDGTAFIAVGSTSGIITSPDGINWTIRASPIDNDLYALAWNGSRLIATGRAGAILTSTDRTNWSLVNSITTQMLEDVSWNGSQFVAVGLAGTMLTSPDGTTWTSRNSGTTKNLTTITWSGTQFVVTGEAGTILTSPDGDTWTARNSGTTNYLWRALWNGSQFLIVGWGSEVLTSPNGVTWTARALGQSTVLFDVAWNGQLYAAVGNNGVIFTSPNGQTWTERASPAAGIGSFHGIVWNGSIFIAVGDNRAAASSPDGLVWTKVDTQSGIALKAITWNGANFIAVGSSGYCISSTDGIDWVIRRAKASDTLSGLAWTGDMFVAVGAYGTIISTTDSSLRSTPEIVGHPLAQTAAKSSTVSFQVVATGSPSPSYQWRKQAAPLPGAIQPTLTLTNVSIDDSADYDVVVTNAAGSVTSNPAALTVLSDYSAWQLGYFTPGESDDTNISGPNADPDSDGLSNLVEYALGLNPKSTDTIGLPTVSITATDWVYTFTRPTDRSDISYAVEFTTDLSTWSSAGVTLTKSTTVGDFETWNATYPLASAPNAFFRLKIIDP